MKNWYIVQSHSSFENKVASLIKEEADKAKISDKIEEIIVPTHDVTEVKRGKRVQRKKKYFPGYVLIKSEMDNNIYHMINIIIHFTFNQNISWKIFLFSLYPFSSFYLCYIMSWNNYFFYFIRYFSLICFLFYETSNFIFKT